MKNSGRLLPTKPNTAEHCNISKLAIKRHLDIDLLDDIIRKLASSEQLPEKNKDHALTGNWVGHRECHIQPDWLLVYRIENDLLVLTLSRTGTHSDLFGKWQSTHNEIQISMCTWRSQMSAAPQATFVVIPEISHSDISYILKKSCTHKACRIW